MRYQYFLARLRNREWKAVLSMTMVNAIPHAVAGLLYKNMHLPAAHDDDFADMEANPKSDSALMEEKMMTLMEQTQGLLLQQQQATRATTSGGTSYNAAAYDIQSNHLSSEQLYLWALSGRRTQLLSVRYRSSPGRVNPLVDVVADKALARAT
ncbi:hypothetical protein PC120_g23007 [Phytophthora cactorum]|nr:hypothetical protein PC120_g23007 [Phytophthora cactorum]